MKIAIIGVGNKLMGDEGIGVHAIEYFRNTPSPLPLSHKGRGNKVKVDLVDGGTIGIALLHLFEKYERVILIDAADFGGRPGDIKIFELDNINLPPDTEQISLHGTSLADVLALALKLGNKLPKITIIAVQPEKITHSMELSDKCKKAIPKIAKAIIV